jgi:hypothetical protein
MTPSGVTMPGVVPNMASLWAGSPTANIHGDRAGGGVYALSPLKPPYSRGMPALACGTCHDSHGNGNLYHLATAVNGTTGIIVSNGNQAKALCAACHEGSATSWHESCNTQCHYGEADHYDSISYYTPGESSDCLSCHKHNGGFAHSGGGCHGDCHGPAFPSTL